MTQMMHDILKLSVAERILMVEAIWDSIAQNAEHVELSSSTIQILDERLVAHQNHPQEGSSWDEVQLRIKNQF